MEAIRKLLGPILILGLAVFPACADEGGGEEGTEADTLTLEDDVDDAIEDAGDAIGDAAEETGEAIKEGAEEVGEAVDEAAEEVNDR